MTLVLGGALRSVDVVPRWAAAHGVTGRVQAGRLVKAA